MTEVTKKQLAEQLGCTKQTITNAMKEVNLTGHVVRRGQTDYFDEYIASVIADKLASRFRKMNNTQNDELIFHLLRHYKHALAESEKNRTLDASRHTDEINQYRNLIDSLKNDLDLTKQLLKDERNITNNLMKQLTKIRELLATAISAPFWRRKTLVKRTLMLPSSTFEKEN